MQDKWVITRMPYKEQLRKEPVKENKKRTYVLISHFIDGKAIELFVEEDLEGASRIGNLYIAKVSKVVKNIDAAFLEIADKQICYYSLKDNLKPFYTNEKKGEKLCAGDELLVQLTKEGMKTKDPVVSSELNFTGRYVVLVHGKPSVGISAKIPEKEKERLRKLMMPFVGADYGFIVRTNAQNANEEAVLAEAEALRKEYETILRQAKHRKVFSCLKSNPPMYCKKLKDISFSENTNLLTDDAEIFWEMQDYLKKELPEHFERLTFYEDTLLPLYKLYSLETVLSDALSQRVWLKSGGYLIIQPTEALTVVDVNSGKFDGKKKKEETFLKINLEAAVEIGRQLKLRNLSGMILVDFINQEQKENQEKLLHAFKEELKKDSVKVTLLGITHLGLVELTRKKVQRPLYEQLGSNCPCCHGAGYIY